MFLCLIIMSPSYEFIKLENSGEISPGAISGGLPYLKVIYISRSPKN